MSGSDFRRLEEIIERLRLLDSDERREYFEWLKSIEPDLYAELRRLWSDEDDDFLEDTSDRIWASLNRGLDLIGREIKQYRIEDVIGRGGMGVVYRATDMVLGRSVALKFLPERLRREDEARRRFLKEARAVARLDHTNICGIFEVEETKTGIPFIAMALYQGETLRDRLISGPLPAREVESVLSQTASGLAAAHAKGLVHRDIKPENLFITHGGEVKILDFGIAALMDDQSDSEHARMMGTVAYMSPEQARGEPATELCDIWALGTIGYEMVTGQAPFVADDWRATMYRILHEEPEALPEDIPPRLVRVIGKCLQKEPSRRFSRAADVGAFLTRSRRVPRLPKRFKMITAMLVVAGLVAGWMIRQVISDDPPVPGPSGPEIHVLPVAGEFGGTDMGALIVGLSEDVLRELRMVEGIDVRDGEPGYIDLGAYVSERGASLALELALADTATPRLEARLYSARKSTMSWTHDFHPDYLMMQAIRDQIVSRVLTEAEVDAQMRREGPSGTGVTEAYEYYLRGLHTLKARLDFGSAIASFQRATALDPEFADAYAALGQTLALKASTGYVFDEGAETFDTARRMAEKALQLDSLNVWAHLAMALILHDHDWEWDKARARFEKARELSPSNPEVYHLYASHLAEMGDVSDAIRFQEIAMDLSPSTPIYFANYLEMLFLEGHPREILNKVEDAPPANADYFFTLIWRAFAHMDVGEFAQARLILDIAQTYFPAPDPLLTAMRARMHALQGNRGRAIELAEIAADKSPVLAASAYAILEDYERAIDLLEIGLARKDVYMTFLKVWPDAEPMQDMRRFRDILVKMGLEE